MILFSYGFVGTRTENNLYLLKKSIEVRLKIIGRNVVGNPEIIITESNFTSECDFPETDLSL